MRPLMFAIAAAAAVASARSAAQSPVPLKEHTFVDLFLSQSVAIKGQLAAEAQESLNLAATDESYAPRLKATAGRFQSEEDAVTPFQPSLSPMDDVTLSIQQQLPSGVSIDGGVFANQKSAAKNSFVDATQVGAKLSLRVDLLKNRLGALDKNKLEVNKIRFDRVALESRITRKRQEIAARKLFWSLIANQESLVLANQLEKSAKKQLADVEARRRLNVADIGELARYRSQLQSRRASILLFEHERTLLWQAVERQSYGLSGSRYVVDVTSARNSELAIGQCLAQVTANKGINNAHTLVDENINAYRDQLNKELETVDKHSGADLAFIGSLQTSGVGASYGKAAENQGEDFKTGRYLGLEFSMPLGAASKQTERAILAAKKAGVEAQADALDLEMKSTFKAMEESLLILQRGLATQKENSANLQTSYRDMLRKFDQGRIPLSMVINEQDALFQSELQEISLQKQIVHTLLDYFSVFSEFPCAWNQIAVSNSTSEVAK